MLRGSMTEPEIILWSKIRRRQVEGCRFRRQYSVGQYVIDFYSPEVKLGIEIDGESHTRTQNIEYDRLREAAIKEIGINFLRFTNAEVHENLGRVTRKICETVAAIREWKSDPLSSPL